MKTLACYYELLPVKLNLNLDRAPLTIFAKFFILYACRGSKYASGNILHLYGRTDANFFELVAFKFFILIICCTLGQNFIQNFQEFFEYIG